MLAAEDRNRVSCAAGWISPVVAGGRVVGVWELAGDAIAVSMFPGSPAPSRSALAAEATAVARASSRPRLAVHTA
jgi:hypothetical protein